MARNRSCGLLSCGGRDVLGGRNAVRTDDDEVEVAVTRDCMDRLSAANLRSRSASASRVVCNAEWASE